MVKKKKFSILIVGLGSIGFRHLKNLQSLGYKDIYVYRTKKGINNYSISKKIKLIQNFDLAITEKKFNLIILSNPTSEHIKFAIKCVKKGINVYIEKPLSHNLKNIQKLVNLSKKSKTKILIGCQLRFNPNLIYIKEFLKRKKLGKIYSVFCDAGQYLPEWHFGENFKKSYAAKKRLGGGVILTLIHEIDYLYWLFGPFKSINSIGGKITNLDINVEDTVCSNIKTKNNVSILLRTDYWRKPPTRTLNIIGEKGQIDWDYFNKELKITDRNGKNLIRKKIKLNNNHNYLNIIKHFINCIEKDKLPKVPLAEGIYTLKVALAIKKSINSSKNILIK